MTVSKDTDDEREWKLALYASIVSDGAIAGLTWAQAEGMRAQDDPDLALSDRTAARRYLRKCILTADIVELQGMLEHDFAALWARGTVGAARYRASKSRRGGRV